MPEKETGAGSRLPVPAARREVTAVWLQSGLRRTFPEASIEEFSSKQIGVGFGLASELFRYRLTGSSCPESVIVKLWQTGGGIGAREAPFYYTFGGEAGGRIPACFYAAVDHERQRAVLVLEDIETLVQGDCLQQLPTVQARALAGQLAGIHARWMESEKLQQAAWLPSLLPWARKQDWFAQRRELFLKRFSDRLNERGRTLLARIEHAPAVTNERLIGAPRTLLHADFHLDNVVFESQLGPVILDWARCTKGPLAFDLYSLLFDVGRIEDSKDVLQAYATAFAETAGTVLDLTELQRQLAGVFLYDFTLSTCGVARWHPSWAREEAMIEIGIERALRALDYWYRKDTELFTFMT